MTALTTNNKVSKKDLMEYFEKTDIPDDASITFRFDGKVFSLFLYWSDGPGAFGRTVVKFDAETPIVIKKIVDMV